MSSDYSEHYLHYQAGRTAMEKNDLVGALASFTKSLELYPHFKTYESIGECLLRQGQHREAITFLAASSALGRKQPRALLLLSRALIHEGHTEIAAEQLDQALAINPDYSSARELLATLTSNAKSGENENSSN